MAQEEFRFNSELSTAVYRRTGKITSPTALLLHGYGQMGEDILSALAPVLPGDWNLVAPTAPYPFYSSKQKKMVGAWFFFDADTRKYVVGRELSQSMLNQWMKQELKPNNELYIFGFSQGAYMAPFAGLGPHRPQMVVTLNGRIRHEELLPIKPAFPFLSLNGENDTTVEVANCIQSADLLKEKGWQIESHIVKGSGHELDANMLKVLEGRKW